MGTTSTIGRIAEQFPLQLKVRCSIIERGIASVRGNLLAIDLAKPPTEAANAFAARVVRDELNQLLRSVNGGLADAVSLGAPKGALRAAIAGAEDLRVASDDAGRLVASGFEHRAPTPAYLPNEEPAVKALVDGVRAHAPIAEQRYFVDEIGRRLDRGERLLQALASSRVAR